MLSFYGFLQVVEVSVEQFQEAKYYKIKAITARKKHSDVAPWLGNGFDFYEVSYSPSTANFDPPGRGDLIQISGRLETSARQGDRRIVSWINLRAETIQRICTLELDFDPEDYIRKAGSNTGTLPNV